MIIEPIILKEEKQNYIEEKNTLRTKEIIKTIETAKEKNTDSDNSRSTNYIVLSVFIYVIGVILGSICFRLWCNDSIIQDEIIDGFDIVGLNDLGEKEILEKSLSNNITTLVIFFVIGISAVGIPIIVFMCFFKGFSYSFIVCTFLLKFGLWEGNFRFIKTVFPYYVFSFIAIILLTASSFKVSNNILRKKKDIRYETLRHFVIALICLFLFFISSYIEMLIMKSMISLE